VAVIRFEASIFQKGINVSQLFVYKLFYFQVANVQLILKYQIFSSIFLSSCLLYFLAIL